MHRTEPRKYRVPFIVPCYFSGYIRVNINCKISGLVFALVSIATNFLKKMTPFLMSNKECYLILLFALTSNAARITFVSRCLWRLKSHGVCDVLRGERFILVAGWNFWSNSRKSTSTKMMSKLVRLQFIVTFLPACISEASVPKAFRF